MQVVRKSIQYNIIFKLISIHRIYFLPFAKYFIQITLSLFHSLRPLYLLQELFCVSKSTDKRWR